MVLTTVSFIVLHKKKFEPKIFAWLPIKLFTKENALSILVTEMTVVIKGKTSDVPRSYQKIIPSHIIGMMSYLKNCLRNLNLYYKSIHKDSTW